MICDFQELYRYLVDDFVIDYCGKLGRKDFILKSEDFSTKRKGRREYLSDCQTHGFIKALNQYFHRRVETPRIRMGDQQKIETLISEEALLFAKYIRNEKKEWVPRISSIGFVRAKP